MKLILVIYFIEPNISRISSQHVISVLEIIKILNFLLFCMKSSKSGMYFILVTHLILDAKFSLEILDFLKFTAGKVS